MVKFARKFILLFFITTFLPLLGLLSFHKMNMENDRKTQEVRMAQQLVMQMPPGGPTGHGELGSHRGQMPFLPPPMPPQKDPPLAIPQIVIILSSLLMCALLVLYMNKIFIIPLGGIIRNLEKIKKGNLDVKFETNSENEDVKRTYATLNEMVTGLVEKEKLQKNFIQNLAHDLRAPINAQNRALTILQDEFGGHELLSGMRENNEDYLKMINLILECYKSEEVAGQIEKAELNLYSLVNSIIAAFEPLAKAKDVAITNFVEPEFKIFGDYISINRILANLIANAIENAQCKKIEISAQKSEVHALVSVRDDGIGIEEEKLGKIFEKYTGYAASAKVVSGMGLSIVKNLVQDQGGEIAVESVAGLDADSYTKFTLKLPRGEE